MKLKSGTHKMPHENVKQKLFGYLEVKVHLLLYMFICGEIYIWNYFYKFSYICLRVLALSQAYSSR